MKKVIYIITTILLCMTSCTDIHDTYSEYIKDGEQIYVGKLADVKIHPGFQRMMITGSMKYLATAKTCIIELVGYDKVSQQILTERNLNSVMKSKMWKKATITLK